MMQTQYLKVAVLSRDFPTTVFILSKVESRRLPSKGEVPSGNTHQDQT